MLSFEVVEKGCYYKCIQAISLNGINNKTRWHISKRTPKKTQYHCAQPDCPCKAEIRLCNEYGEELYEAIIFGSHQNHMDTNAKPLREHLVVTVAKAVSSGAKGIKEAIATEVQM